MCPLPCSQEVHALTGDDIGKGPHVIAIEVKTTLHRSCFGVIVHHLHQPLADQAFEFGPYHRFGCGNLLHQCVKWLYEGQRPQDVDLDVIEPFHLTILPFQTYCLRLAAIPTHNT